MTIVENASHTRPMLKSLLKPSLSIAANTSITIAANVSVRGAPVTQGTVTFFDGTVALASETMSSAGTASFITILGSGAHDLSSTYNGSGSASASTSISTTVLITPVLTNVLTNSGAPGDYTLHSIITGGAFDIPGGTGTFVDGTTGATLGNATVTPGNVELHSIIAPGSPIKLGGTPVFAAEGDFNGDHETDLAIVDSSASLVTILTGDSTGKLTVGSPISIISTPIGAVAADFNRDSKDDLAIATTSGKVIVLLARGNGQFYVASTVIANSNAAIVSGDFNGDGNADLAAADNTGAGSVTILLGRLIAGLRQFSSDFAPALYHLYGHRNWDFRHIKTFHSRDAHCETCWMNLCQTAREPKIKRLPPGFLKLG